MGNEFTALRARAREKRDKAIDHARSEYQQTLVSIAALEQDLAGTTSSRHKPVSACISSIIPRDEPFTAQDILAALEALDAGRVWHRKTVDGYLTKLRIKGIIRRMRRHKGPEPAVYVWSDAKVDRLPFENMTLPEVMRAVLTEPMTQTELTVRMREAGYDSTMENRVLRNVVGEELRRGGFRRHSNGKWSTG
jgi:hypothetical protein